MIDRQRDAALEEFNLRFAKRDLDSVELPKVSAAELGDDLVSAIVTAYSKGFGIVKSRSEARRLLEQGSVQWRGEKITNPKERDQLHSRRSPEAG